MKRHDTMSHELTDEGREALIESGFQWALDVIDDLTAKLAAKDALAEQVAQINAGLLAEARKPLP